VPNGEAGTTIIPLDILEGPDVPGTPIPSGPIGGIISTVVDFFSGIFGGGGHDPGEHLSSLSASTRNDAIQEVVRGEFPLTATAVSIIRSFQQVGVDVEAVVQTQRALQGRDPVTGRLPIPLPEQGGPELVTERFRNLPPIPDVPELVSGTLGFEGIQTMPVDVPLLGSFLPAVRSVVQPSIQGIVGGLAGGFLSEFLRAPQELGMAQVPARAGVPAVGGCPTEKPHTRILRFIKQNTGVSINLSRAKSLIRELGLENAARCLGIGAGEVCSLLIVASPRRRRGISASDIRIVKRTARRFENLKHDLGHLGGRAHTHRRATHRHRHAHK